MPVIFEYFGIILQFFSNEHLPIHVHAYYGSQYAMKVEFYLSGDVIESIEYKGVRGYKHFPPAQIRDLKKLVETYQYEIVNDWLTFILRNQRVKKKTITKKLK
jgi:hypothetical protein